MDLSNHQDYYSSRARTSRILAERAMDPAIAAIHTEFAARYERLAIRYDWDYDIMPRTANAA